MVVAGIPSGVVVGPPRTITEGVPGTATGVAGVSVAMGVPCPVSASGVGAVVAMVGTGGVIVGCCPEHPSTRAAVRNRTPRASNSVPYFMALPLQVLAQCVVVYMTERGGEKFHPGDAMLVFHARWYGLLTFAPCKVGMCFLIIMPVGIGQLFGTGRSPARCGGSGTHSQTVLDSPLVTVSKRATISKLSFSLSRESMCLDHSWAGRTSASWFRDSFLDPVSGAE